MGRGARTAETIGVPARTRGPVGDRLDHREIKPVEVGGRLEVDRLAEIVGRRVVTLARHRFMIWCSGESLLKPIFGKMAGTPRLMKLY